MARIQQFQMAQPQQRKRDQQSLEQQAVPRTRAAGTSSRVAHVRWSASRRIVQHRICLIRWLRSRINVPIWDSSSLISRQLACSRRQVDRNRQWVSNPPTYQQNRHHRCRQLAVQQCQRSRHHRRPSECRPTRVICTNLWPRQLPKEPSSARPQRS